ncbi:MAG: hypothetical protein KIT84_14230 [Labilithrix sp.]|nr:hypothetical protein [Labilithrix sp.]MCW5812179.1 hypothetical protein [Labilithrix sp.]
MMVTPPALTLSFISVAPGSSPARGIAASASANALSIPPSPSTTELAFGGSVQLASRVVEPSMPVQCSSRSKPTSPASGRMKKVCAPK